MSSHSKQIGPRMFHVVEHGREFIEAAVVFRGEPTIRQFDVVPGSLGATMATAKQWQEEHYDELKTTYKRDYNRKKERADFERKLQADIQASKEEAFERMLTRVTHNDAVVRAAKDDVRRVLAFYGPALFDRVLYVPPFQWI